EFGELRKVSGGRHPLELVANAPVNDHARAVAGAEDGAFIRVCDGDEELVRAANSQGSREADGLDILSRANERGYADLMRIGAEAAIDRRCALDDPGCVFCPSGSGQKERCQQHSGSFHCDWLSTGSSFDPAGGWNVKAPALNVGLNTISFTVSVTSRR